MKLPDKIPRELLALIVDKVHDSAIEDTSPIIEAYDVITEYFNSLSVDWRPVSERPLKNCDVWLWNKAQGKCTGFYIAKTMKFHSPMNKPTHWTYCNMPESPKELVE